MLNRTHPFRIMVNSHSGYKILLESKRIEYIDIDQINNRGDEIRNLRTAGTSFRARCLSLMPCSVEFLLWCLLLKSKLYYLVFLPLDS